MEHAITSEVVSGQEYRIGSSPESVGQPLLSVSDLSIAIQRDHGSQVAALAVEEVSFDIDRRMTFCLVGESGCGKSVTALSLLHLLPCPPVHVISGKANFKGRDLLGLDDRELRKVRGDEIGMIFQEPMTSLNPVMRIGSQLAEGLRLHRRMSGEQGRKKSIELLEMVEIPQAGQRAREYPHQMSGGMRQRVMIAMAMACEPTLLIADEPTTALDVTMQRQILILMQKLMSDTSGALLLITHDFGVVEQIGDYVAVMYAGKIVEQGPADVIMKAAVHPYTKGLLSSRPSLFSKEKKGRLSAIPGTVPGLWERPAGCAFHPRCPYSMEICRSERPPFVPVWAGHHSRCWLHK